MDRGTSLPHNPRLPLYPLRLLRLEPGETFEVWITHHIDGGRIKGLFIRHIERQSNIISPEDAKERVRGRPGVWKGYVSGLVWRAPEKKWVPVVIEVTERSEQDFRGKVARGQVWTLSKAPYVKGKNQPLRARYLETRPEADTPPALDVIPKLRNDIFRQEHIPLTSDNPLPDLVVVAPVESAAPGDFLPVKADAEKRPRVKLSDRFSDSEVMKAIDFGKTVDQHLNGRASQ